MTVTRRTGTRAQLRGVGAAIAGAACGGGRRRRDDHARRTALCRSERTVAICELRLFEAEVGGIVELARPPRHAVLPHRHDARRLVSLTSGLRHTLLVVSLEERGPQFRRGDGRSDVVLEVLLERLEHEQRRAGRDDREALPKPDEIVVVRLGVDAEGRQTLLRPQLLDEAGRLR